MKITDTIYLSFETFKSRKSRTSLTVLGVGVGIGAVLFLVSLGYGMQRILLERITTAESFLTLDVATPDSRVVVLDDGQVKKISQIPHVQKVSPQAIISAEITANNLTAESVLNLVDQDFFNLSGSLPQYGRNFKDNDQQKIVVNSKVAELFNKKSSEMIGQNLRFTAFYPKASADENSSSETDTGLVSNEQVSMDINKNFEVVGVIEEQDAAAQVYMLHSDVPELPLKEYQVAKIKVDASKNLEPVREQLIGMGFLVSALSDVVDQANKVFMVVQIVLGVFGVIAVVVAAISLANTMTISLLERTGEIGVMRALGASRRDIRNLFWIESTLIGFLGGVAGIALGFIGSFLFNQGVRLLARALGGQPVNLFSTPLWFLIFIMVFSTTVGWITGVVPSRRAAQINPLEALKYK